MIGRGWLGRRVRVFAGYDWRRAHGPIAEGEVVAYCDAPTITVRHPDGSQSSWPITLPIDTLDPVDNNRELWR